MVSQYKLLTTLTRKTSVTLNIPEYIVDEVINHQFKNAHEAIKKHSSIELSGLGKFTIRKQQVKNKINTLTKYKTFFEKKLEGMEEGNPDRYSLKLKLNKILEDIEFLNSKYGD